MGLGGISIWQLLIVLAIVVMVFGTSRLRSLGGDLGSAIKGFKSAMQEPEAAQPQHKEMTDNVDPAAIAATPDERSTTA